MDVGTIVIVFDSLGMLIGKFVSKTDNSITIDSVRHLMQSQPTANNAGDFIVVPASKNPFNKAFEGNFVSRGSYTAASAEIRTKYLAELTGIVSATPTQTKKLVTP